MNTDEEKLLYAWSLGLDDDEALAMAGMTEVPDHLVSVGKLIKKTPLLKAKLLINKELESGNVNVAMWYYEQNSRRCT